MKHGVFKYILLRNDELRRPKKGRPAANPLPEKTAVCLAVPGRNPEAGALLTGNFMLRV